MAQKTTNKRNTPTKEIGSSGIRVFNKNGVKFSDPLKLLQGTKKYIYFEEMSMNHPIIGAFILMHQSLIRSVTFDVKPAGNSQEDINNAEFIRSVLFDDMDTSFYEPIVEAYIGSLIYGFDLHEPVFKKRLGYNTNPAKKSKFNDGKFGLRKMALRPQTTIDEWMFTDDGRDVKGVKQINVSNMGSSIEIPIERLLHFKIRSVNNSPEGVSVLRNCVIPYFDQKQTKKLELLRYDRGFDGVPVIKAPPQLLSQNSTNADVIAFQNWAKQTVANIRSGEDSGIVAPNYANFEIEILSNDNPMMPSGDQIIERANKDIAMSLLSDFFLAGQKQNASGNFAQAKLKVFSSFASSILDTILDQINNKLIPKLFRMNGIMIDEYPKVIHCGIESLDLTSVMLWIQSAHKTGTLTPTVDTENYIRQIVFGPNAPQVTEEQWDQQQQRDDQNVIVNTKDPQAQTYDEIMPNVDNDNSDNFE